jgi:hypothetical protein
LGIASDEGNSPSDVQYVNYFVGQFVDQFKLKPTFVFQKDYDASTPDNIIDIISAGTSWISYVGHGTGTAWASVAENSFDISDIAKVKNAEKMKPIIIDVACQNGRLSKGRFGERWMNSTDKAGHAIGAVAYYGGSVNISWDPPGVMTAGINRLVAEKKLAHLGEALMAGQLFLAANWAIASHIKDNLAWFHLQGDPSLLISYTSKR